MLGLHVAELDSIEDFDGVLIVRITDLGVCEPRLEILLDWELPVAHFDPAIHVIVLIDSLPHQQHHILRLQHEKHLSAKNETLEASLLQDGGEESRFLNHE